MASFSTQKIDAHHPLFPQVFALREKVLRLPLGLSLYNEDTSGDVADDVFIALTEEKEVIGCLMAKNLGQNLLKLRQMAVAEEWQGKGVGNLLMQKAEADAVAKGFKKIELHARQNAIGFYEQLGYKGSGELFMEVTIPHRTMEKFL